jgi:hypothetical protein
LKEVTSLFAFRARFFFFLPMVFLDEFGAFAAFFVASGFAWLDPRAEDKEVEDKREQRARRRLR